MKAGDLKPCAICGKGVMHAGTPIFYTVQIQTMGVDLKAVERTHGLELAMGGGSAGALLARVMGPDPDIAKPLEPRPVKVLICMPCALEPRPLGFLLESSA